MIVTFVIPNLTDPEKPPTLYDNWGAEAVPRVGETVYLPEEGTADGKPWTVKWVRHTFQIADRDRPTHQIEVRLTEPGH